MTKDSIEVRRALRQSRSGFGGCNFCCSSFRHITGAPSACHDPASGYITNIRFLPSIHFARCARIPPLTNKQRKYLLRPDVFGHIDFLGIFRVQVCDEPSSSIAGQKGIKGSDTFFTIIRSAGATNSWNFALIDYFHDMSLLRDGHLHSLSLFLQPNRCRSDLDTRTLQWSDRYRIREEASFEFLVP
jgi:hypothetical protein